MHLRQVLNNSKIGVIQKINYVKTKENPKKFYQFFQKNSLLNKFLNKNLFPSNINDIKHNEPYSFTNSFEVEFYWIYTKILFNIEQIKKLIDSKEEIENLILLGKNKEARESLKLVVESYGYSLWAIETDLHLAENEIGSSENWKLLTEYLNTIQNSFYEFCINGSSKKVEEAVSFESYVNQLQNDVNSINALEFIKDFFVFNNLKTANYNYEFEDLSGVLYVSNIFSIFDQYNIFIDVIIFNLSKGDEKSNLFKLVAKTLLNGGIRDNRLINIYNFLSKDEMITIDRSKNIYLILEEYYLGEYLKALNLSKDYLNYHALEFEVYEVYVKSLIHLERKFEKIDVYPIDCILENLYYLLQFPKDIDRYARKLMKYTLKYNNSFLGVQIMDFISEIENNHENSLRYSFYSSYNSYKLFLKRADVQQDSSDKIFGFSKYNFFYYKKILLGSPNSDLNQYISNLFSQKINAEVIFCYNNKNYERVIDLILGNGLLENTLNYLKERYTFYLYNSFLMEDRIDECLNLFGRLFFDESTIYLKINYQDLYQKTFKEDDKYVYANNVNALILASIFDSEYDLYEILDEFLGVSNIDIDNFMDIEITTKDEKQFIFILNKICTIDTLKYYFNQIEKVEELRIQILEKLSFLDGKNKKVFEKEIVEINRKISVRKVIKEVNNGRLFVDIPKLKEQLVEKYDDDFNRLMRIVYEKRGTVLLGFNSSKPRDWERTLKEQETSDIDKYNDADFIAFKNIYYDVREQFLFSKEYGLDSCLSTRIRHGSLENQLRSVFENLHLVTTKLDETYIDDDFWTDKVLDDQVALIIQRETKIFSRKIDEYNSFLKNRVIQITHENMDNADAKFSYFSNDEILYTFYHNHIEYLKTTEDIVDILLNDLSHHTNFTLCLSIYKYFTNEVYFKFSDFVNHYISNIRNLHLPKSVYLVDNLNKSLTDLQLCLEEIVEWFWLETSSSSNLLLIEDIINASFELTRKLYKNIEIKSTLNVTFKEVSGYSSLIYVFNILFSNSIIHSGLDDSIDIHVDVNLIEDNYVKIDIKNNYFSMDKVLTSSNLERVKSQWKDFQNIERSNIEGESGFHKIKRIMIYEAKCITDKFDYNIDDNFVTISLFLIYKKPNNDENSDNRG